MTDISAGPETWPEDVARLAGFGAMTARLVHDLNNLLAVAGGYLELAQLAPARDGTHMRAAAGALDQMTELLVSVRTMVLGPGADLTPGWDTCLADWHRSLALAVGRNVRLELEPGLAAVVEADGAQQQKRVQMLLLCVCLDAAGCLPDGGVVRLGWKPDPDTVVAAFHDRAGRPLPGRPPDRGGWAWWTLAERFAALAGVRLQSGFS